MCKQRKKPYLTARIFRVNWALAVCVWHDDYFLNQSFVGASSGCEYGCRPPSGNCLHLKQENHYHQHYLQVGEGSRVVFQSNGTVF